MTGMPPAIALLLPILAADGGRARADTLLGILGAGPDYVRQHLGEIGSALGAQSPGVSSLSALVDLAEEAVSTSRPTVARQHVISQVVMRKFVESVRAGNVLARVDLGTGKVVFSGPSPVGYVENFVPVDSKATEELWQQVENRLNPAIAAALNGTALGNPTHLSTLKNAVALHFVRNPQTLTAHNRSFADALDKQLDRVAKTPLAAQAFRERYGLEPAGPQAMRLGAEAAHERLVTLHKQGGLFRLSVQRLFEKVCDRFDARGVEILTPTSAAKEFLLGDVPSITVEQATGAYGLSQGIAVDGADEVFMPLTPRLLVAIGPPDGTRSISDDEVDAYNEMEVREAKGYVLHRPGANLDTSIAAWRI
jgi:hypothetical protein